MVKGALLLVLFVASVGLLAIGGGRERLLVLTIPKLAAAPKVDGNVGEGEWAGATAVPAFFDLETHLLSPRETVAFLGYTDDALYIAFLCFGPTPESEKRPKDGKGIWEDDAVEVLLDPGRTLSRHFQFIGNAEGSVWDSIGDDPSWDAPGWRFATKPLPEGGWGAEFEIPFSSLGVGSPKPGDIWGLNLARDCRAGGRANLCLAPVVASFHETEKFVKAKFGSEGEFARILSLGKPQRGEVKVSAELPEGAAMSVKVSGEKGKVKEFKLSGRAMAEARVEERGRYEISLEAAKGKEVLLNLTVPFDREPKVPLEIVKRFLTKRGVDLRADLSSFEGKAVAVRVRLLDRSGESVKELTLRPSTGKEEAKGFVSVEGVKPGEYKVEATALDDKGKALATEVYDLTIPERPPWLGSKVGVMGPDEVPPPWTPLEVSGRSVKVWGRTYRLSAWGLPESVVSRGEEILANPVRFELGGGKRTLFRGELRLVERHAGKCRFYSEGKFGTLGWRCTATVEFDGMMRFDIELLPQKPTRLEGLTLIVPLKSRHAKYLHYWPWGWGKVCTNSFALRGPWRFRFRPVIFLSDEERGLCWFSESDEPFDLRKPEEAVEVLPQGKLVLLKVNIFDHTVELSSPWRWTFGLQATPVKSVPVAWWLKERIVHWGSYGLETSPAPKPVGSIVYPAEGNINPMRGTLEAWLKPEFDPWDPEIDKVPIGERGQFNNSFFSLTLKSGDSVDFYWNADDKGMRFYAQIGGTYPIVLGAKSPTMGKGKWSHVALTWGDEIRIYVDGELTCRRKWEGLFGKPVSLDGAEIVIGGGRCDFVVDEIRISDVERTSFDLTKPPERDEHTLLLDRLDCDFEPDGELTTSPEAGKPGTPSRETAFVEGKFGKGLRLFTPLPPGWEKMTYLDTMKAIGAKTLIFHEHWTEIQNYYDTFEHGERLKSLVKACHERGLKLAVYFGYEMSDIAPEYKFYAQECLAWKPGMWFYTRLPAQKAYRVCYNSHWADFLAWGIHHALTKYDLDGVYLDGTASPSDCDNELHGCGYVDKEGKRHPTFPIFAVRELMKRIYKICLDHRGKEVFVNVHNSTGLYIPTLAFATSYWDGEQFAPLKHGQFKPLEIVPLDAFRAEFMGKNAGIPADFLVYPGSPWLYEEALALALPHDVLPRPPGGPASKEAKWASLIWKAFSQFGAQEAEWVPYWRSERFVKAEPKGVCISLYVKRGKGAIAVVSNFSDSEAKATLRFQPLSLGLDKIHEATEILSGRSIPVARGSTVELTLKPIRCAILLLR